MRETGTGQQVAQLHDRYMMMMMMMMMFDASLPQLYRSFLYWMRRFSAKSFTSQGNIKM